jgi:hypothetical protein
MGIVRAMGGNEIRIAGRRKKRIHHRGHGEHREKKIKPESTDLDPSRPTRKIGVWGTREKPRANQEHRLKPVLPVAWRFCGGLGWDKMAGEGLER